MRRFFFVFLMFAGLGIAQPILAATQAQIWMGWIVAPKSSPNTLWYVWPRTKERMAASTLEDIRTILRTKALKIKYQDLIRIPLAGTTTEGDVAFRRRLAGQFVVVTDRRSQAWYIHPRYKRRYLLGQGQAAVDFLRSQRVLLGDEALATIPIMPNLQTIIGNVTTSRGTFLVERVVMNWNDSGIRIAMDTANTSNCDRDCPAISLGSYITRRAALAGIHGTYFCPPDYASCAGRINFYHYPVWNTFTKSWRNGDRIKFTAEPIVAFDSGNRPFLFPETRVFTSEADFSNEFRAASLAAGGTGVLQAAISNGPMLRRNGAHALDPKKMDSKQATVKSARGGLGWNGTTFMVFIAHGATVTDLAAVAAALNLDNALNLDGGGSSALYADRRYIVGPGRNLPNALVITRR